VQVGAKFIWSERQVHLRFSSCMQSDWQEKRKSTMEIWKEMTPMETRKALNVLCIVADDDSHQGVCTVCA
jgi:hypothetical protein